MRWLRRLFVLLLVLVVALAVAGVLIVRRSFPQTNGEITLPGLEEPVQVIRDIDGIPHIYASNPHDLFLAQGYVVAQDRFWQMDFFRHIGSARLSEMLGESGVETDQFLRSLGLVALAEIELASLSPQVRDSLEWYAEGVNAYLAEHSGSAVSLEYAVLGLINSGYEIEPWHPIDTLTWAKIMSWDLGRNMEDEIERAVLTADLLPERVEQLYPEFPNRHPVIVQGDQLAASPDQPPALPDAAITALSSAGSRARRVWEMTGGGFEGIGSNNWVIGGSMTDTGMPILANDTHLGIRMPSIWYEVSLHCTGPEDDCVPDVTGFTFAGSPGIVVGHNEHIAWGVTTEAVDTQDLYIEKVNPDDPTQYEVEGEWIDMELRTETIEVAGAADIQHEVRVTRHGPVISGALVEEDVFEDTIVDPQEEYVVALSWQSLKPSTLVEAIVGINRATNFEEFRAAAGQWDIAPQNLVYADIRGNIAYQSTGEIPVRANHDGRYPVPGWASEYEWTGLVPYEEMPHLLNPPQGYVASANQPVTRPGAGPFEGFDGARGYRANRIVELLGERPEHSVETVQAMQMDARDGGAEQVVPYLIDCVGCSGGYEGFQEVTAILEEWVYRMEGDQSVFRKDGFQATGDSRGGAVYQAVWRHLLRHTFHDELPEDHRPRGGARWFEVVKNLLEDPHDPWWDDIHTIHVETRDDIIEQAIIDAHIELTDLLGSNSEDWTWGRLHTARFENETLGQSGIAPIEWLFNRTAPKRVGGSQSLINAVWWDPNESYEVTWLPSFRMVIDLSDLSNSTSVNTTGNSGHAFHRHYDDMIEAWTDGEQHPMRWTREQIERDAAASLSVVPEG